MGFKKLPKTKAKTSKQRLVEIVDGCEQGDLQIKEYYILGGARQDHLFPDITTCRTFEDGFEAVYRGGERGFIHAYPKDEPNVIVVYEKMS